MFGYTLVNDWRARDASGAPVETADGLPLAIGPCVVTADDVDPAGHVPAGQGRRRRGRERQPERSGRSLFALVAEASKLAVLERGDALALGPFGNDLDRELWPGASVELAAEGIGTLRNRVARPR